MFRYLVLGLLRNGAAHHGYALMKAYRDRSGLSISTGNFYRELQRLVGEGLVRTAANPPGADARRAPYEITQAGTAAFDAWLPASPTGAGCYEDELSSRAIFIIDAEPDLTRRVIDNWREELWMRGKLLERTREAALTARGHGNGRAAASLAVLLARRLKHVAADLEFLEELRLDCEARAAAAAKRQVPQQDAAAGREMTKRARSAAGNGR